MDFDGADSFEGHSDWVAPQRQNWSLAPSLLSCIAKPSSTQTLVGTGCASECVLVLTKDIEWDGEDPPP
jgi:hypothetical protein